MKNFKFIDLFAGIGGFRLGFEKVGGSCVFSSEWDENAKKTYFNNFNEIPHGDITKINPCDIPKFDVLLGGFPCQPFSVSGKKKGFDDTRGTLFFNICDIINHHKPKLVVLENVKHIIHHDNGNTLKTILKKLKDLGYYCSYQLLNAKNLKINDI